MLYTPTLDRSHFKFAVTLHLRNLSSSWRARSRVASASRFILLHISKSTPLIFHTPVGIQEVTVAVLQAFQGRREGQIQVGRPWERPASEEGPQERIRHYVEAARSPGVRNLPVRHIRLQRVVVALGDQMEVEEAGSATVEDDAAVDDCSGSQMGDQRSQEVRSYHRPYHDRLRSFAVVRRVVARRAVAAEVVLVIARCVSAPGRRAFARLGRRAVLLCRLFCMRIAPRSPCSSDIGRSCLRSRRLTIRIRQTRQIRSPLTSLHHLEQSKSGPLVRFY